MRRIVIVVFGMVCLAGCATTTKTPQMDVQTLRSRLDVVETELKVKDQEVGRLQDEIEQVRQECLEAYDSSRARSRNNLIPAVAAGKRREEDSGKFIRVEGVSAEQVQVALKRAGFYQGPLDGKAGPKTREAVKAFQKANNIRVDGVIGRETWARLKKKL